MTVSGSSAVAGDADYLSTGEAIGLGAASLVVFKSGNCIKRMNAHVAPRWVKPPGFDEKISRFLGREAGIERQNILDSDFGSAITTLGAGLCLGLTDWHHPRSDRSKDLWQGQFVFYSGALTTKGITDIFKGIVARQRPLLYCEPELAATRPNPNQADDHYSFFSGHAASAFYAMTFLNLRIRAAMRQGMTTESYRSQRWLPSTLCFGWAGYVAFSRIQAYRHYLTDILAGSLVGYLLGELYYSLNDGIKPKDNSGSFLYLQIRIGF